MRKLRRSPFSTGPTHRKRFPPLILVGVVVSLAIALIGAGVFVLPHIGSHAAQAVNGDCTLIVPAQPLTAQGLATPYQLVATNPDNGPCNEANAAQSAFVQAAIIDPNTGKIAVYDPLVVDQGTQPAMAPVVPTLPNGGIVGIWFGSNGNTLTLQDTNNSLQDGNCVKGVAGSIFGQFSYCNAPNFFQAANQAIQAGKLVPPPIGKAKDGLTCPTSRDFSIVDQDQSDNVTTFYLVTASGQVAQDTQANAATLQGQGQVAKNGSDERLLTVVDGALGCTPWMVPDLANPGQMATALPLNEIQAASHQAAPVALVPSRDPMVLVGNKNNLDKLNSYRVGVDQLVVQNLNSAGTRNYCTNLLAVAPQRLMLDARFTKALSSPDPAAANTLFTFLAQRFVTTYGAAAPGLNCAKLIGQPDPISVKTNGDGVAIDATINGTTIFTPVDCSVNGTVLVGCSGTTTINGQSCSLVYDRNAHQVKITCPAAG
ncbi:MAG TPA: hypothetical protein VNW73_10170 [Ktedonobacteraceae bacterium]|nr:hypothetical protein [Ktedonobacteraceae bacterium]